MKEHWALEAVLTFLLGAQHGLAPDHLAAITALITRGAGSRQAATTGAKFGLAHAFVLFVLGGIIILLGQSVPEAWEEYAEGLSGLVLVGLGVWMLSDVWRGHKRDLEHVHDHCDVHLHRIGTSHLVAAIGGMCALCGIRSVLMLGVITAAVAKSMALAMSYVLVFGLGVFLASTAYGLAASKVLDMAAKPRFVGVLTGVVGALSAAMGLFWIWGVVR
ncbi:MAG: hypothetical protein FJ272_17625 [Planctomycetes bacterium]|nr:hypothetical protein [Planctomycetota bacterium]